MEDGRYNKIHSDGKVEFTLSDFNMTEDQSRFLVLKILEQAIRDYCAYQNPKTKSEREACESAHGFLFDDDWRIGIGDWELSPAELLDFVDLDIEWVRKQTLKKLREYNGKKE